LINWDYFNNPERQAPTIYEVWWNKINDKLWDEIDSSEVAVYRPNWYNTVEILKKHPDFFMIDNQLTPEKESAGDIFRITFKETIDHLENHLAEEGNSLLWYQYKNTTIRHLLRISAFSKSKVKIGGNRSIVNAASATHGPSWRMVVELGDGEVKAWGVYPGSQSGNPGNPTYGHQIEDWATGIYNELLFENNLDAEHPDVIHTITIKPKQ
jgi:penicillin amidase